MVPVWAMDHRRSPFRTSMTSKVQETPESPRVPPDMT